MSDPTAIPQLSLPVPQELPYRAFVDHIMGMPISVHIRGPQARSEEMAQRVDRVFDELRWVDAVFSTYRDDTPLNRYRHGQVSLRECPVEVAEIEELCRLAKERTEGWFDAWRPEADGVVRFEPTGVVKGWGVARSARVFDDLEDHDFYVNAGGDIVAECRRLDTEPWKIGVENPLQGDEILAVIPIVRGGVATSGTAARGLHIDNPFTGRPADDLASLTICGESLVWCDIYATAGFARGPASRDWLATLAGYSAVVVDRSGTPTVVLGGGGTGSGNTTGGVTRDAA